MILSKNSLSIRLLILFLCLSYKASAQQGSWELLDVSGQARERHENSFVELGDKFYLLGGRSIKPVNIFDPKTNTWTTGQEPPLELHHFQAVAYQGKIYIIGAMTGKYPMEKPLERILSYNPKTNNWEWGAIIPQGRRRGSAGVVVVGDKAIIVSGITNGHWDGHVPWVDEYNFKTGKWTILPDAPRARDHFHAVYHQEMIYCAGGRNSSAKTNQTFNLTLPEVDVYDTNTKKWNTLPADNHLPTLRAGASNVVLKNKIFVIGGESVKQTTAHQEVEAFDIKNKTWNKVAPLTIGRHGTQAIVYKGAIYIVAGSGKQGGKPELSSIEKFKF